MLLALWTQLILVSIGLSFSTPKCGISSKITKVATAMSFRKFLLQSIAGGAVTTVHNQFWATGTRLPPAPRQKRVGLSSNLPLTRQWAGSKIWSMNFPRFRPGRHRWQLDCEPSFTNARLCYFRKPAAIIKKMEVRM